MSTPVTLTGQCHCGNVNATIALSQPASEISLRACQCTFCRRHGAVSLADPDGEAVFSFGDDSITKYNFGLGVTDFLICPRCGIYVAATMADGDRLLAVVNSAGLSLKEFADHEALPMDYDGEDVGNRLARRKSKWMPARILD